MVEEARGAIELRFLHNNQGATWAAWKSRGFSDYQDFDQAVHCFATRHRRFWNRQYARRPAKYPPIFRAPGYW